ncbi:hypothetical protein J8J14_12600 [Roseomonas sp. SSH11]|uniref:Elastin n=1 Tax=Pararoseomonas baculiformis TaxID=2820812 RepID=A0ABS4AFG2_9PROT|nr:hypothetical protein [Pararoseomonas baculiformis]MBP0445616.1 hypothetical protein [Pararoseomonas baculiformis]
MPRRHRNPCIGPTLLAAAFLASNLQPALAQGELRSITVPAEGGVVIPPRSTPRLAARPASAGTGVPIPPGTGRGGPVLLPDTGTGLGVPLLGMVLPAIAGAVLGGSLAGSGGAGTAPARTR